MDEAAAQREIEQWRRAVQATIAFYPRRCNMLTREVLRQVRRLQLRARRAVEDPLGGEYRSVFKGTGIAFEEVREYQPGDEIRTIDWNVTARMGHPFIKRYIEERELTVVLPDGLQRQHQFGTVKQQARCRRRDRRLAGAAAPSAIMTRSA